MIKEEQFSQLLELSKAMGSIQTLEQLGNLFVDKISQIFRVKRVSLMLLDREKKDLYIWATSGKVEELKKVRVEYGQMFAGWVAKEGEPLLVKNVDSEFPAYAKNKLGRYQSKSFLIVPIKTQDKTIGVINITERKNTDTFTEEDLKLIFLINPLLILQIEKIQLLEQIENLSIIDSLTGLFNHRYFQEHLSGEIDRVQRYRRQCSLITINIDNFQEYNENYGYAMGDRILAQMANTIKDNLRKVDIIARYAGEEFAIILPDTGIKQAAMVAEKLIDKIKSSVFVERRDSSLAIARLTVSAGVAEYDIRNTKEEFIQQAKHALQEAKRKGKNCVCAFK